MRSGQLNPSHVPRALSSIWRLLSISTPINRMAGTFNGLKSHRGDLRCCYNDLTLQFNIQHFCNSLIWFKLKFLNTAVDSTALEIIHSSSQCIHDQTLKIDGKGGKLQPVETHRSRHLLTTEMCWCVPLRSLGQNASESYGQGVGRVCAANTGFRAPRTFLISCHAAPPFPEDPITSAEMRIASCLTIKGPATPPLRRLQLPLYGTTTKNCQPQTNSADVTLIRWTY